MAREEGDDETLEAIEVDVKEIEKVIVSMEFRRMFNNPMDPNNCFIDIQAGAGGTEAQDWASMLLRQYLRYCERKGFKVEILEQSEGEVAGIKTATLKVEGDHAYGFLRTETGVHRLVRKSPFDSANGRHTSFTSLFVYPEVDDSIEIDVNPADIRVDTYRASGAGGTEAQDWASMLLRQYLRYCERKGFKVEILEQSEGEVAGIKTATLKVEGDHAYGFLRTETGVHRLVRKSPFDSANGRHTSFTSLFVYPEVDDSIEIDVNPADIRVDTYRASGAGGQHINKTDSAVRMTHAPTGIVVQCQNDRSQHRNRAEAMEMLKAKLYEHELRKRMSEQQKLEDSKTDVGWGHQIRSYVLDQSRIKDLRTGFETGNTKGVLDGDIDDFISASLKQGV